MNIHDVQVNLRLPIELKEKIQEIAKRNGHTLNAELNMRLKDSLSTPTQGNQKQALEDIYGFFENYQKNRRLVDVSSRLHLLVNETNKLHELPLINPSLLAYQLDFASAGMVEAWYEGRLEPTFNELKKVAEFFGCCEEWLLFGMGTPYQVKKLPSYDNFDNFLNFMIEPDQPYRTLIGIHLIRYDNILGELGLIKQYSDKTCQFYTTEIFLNENLTEEQAQTTAFYSLIIYALTHADIIPECFGYVMDGELFQRILAGKEHPLKLVNKAARSEWYYDLFDINFGHDKKNWVNWADFYEKNLTFIKNTPYLNEIYTRLLNQQHPIFQSNFPFFDIE